MAPKTNKFRGLDVAGAVGVTAIVAAEVLRRRRQRVLHEQQSWLINAGAKLVTSDDASVFELLDVDRSPSGRVGGAGSLRCSDIGERLSVSAMVADVPGLVLYSIEVVEGEVLLLFMQVPSVPEVMDLPFLDRGVRKVAEVGSKVYVARLEAVEEAEGIQPLHLLPAAEQARFSIVWNVGRCGSTLMHRMLCNVGVLSFSEPFWLDRLFDLKLKGIDEETVGRAFGVCGAVDVVLARKSLPSHPPVFGAATTAGAAHVSFNAKGKGFRGMEAIIKCVPDVRHVFMYRDILEVSESFGSIFFKRQSKLSKVLSMLRFWDETAKEPGIPVPEPGIASPVFSKAVAEAEASGALTKPSTHTAKWTTMAWLETMALWRELTRDGVIRQDDTITLRMKDYVRQDPDVIETILRFVLGEGVEVGEDIVTVALEAFVRHSQEGDLMSQSSYAKGSGKQRFLTAQDVEEIKAAVAAVPLIGSPDIVLPGSLGVPSGI